MGSDVDLCGILWGVEGRGQKREVAVLGDIWGSSQSSSPWGGDAVKAFLSELLETSSVGEGNRFFGETGGEEVSPGLFGVLTAVSFSVCAGSSA